MVYLLKGVSEHYKLMTPNYSPVYIRMYIHQVLSRL